ncbi:helix-turn-helix transcriptional regulator [Sagittula sp. MA-2]|jgi:DNA-binding transcriptional ArsR family regulator|uniref:ArsR/SmtB family transcription factor n=1 Tax=Sagittula sp. MA-2 TaxID=3048007 RepID=UPI0024C2BE16|nr:metalloregulator ArsR/SmtB family transcription factor [Sagittula sp. MA-2]WHZ33995.1 metalloregulator ArsR/SmtB family transcription factor [Sagittula sp. MA-2]
MVEYSKDLDRAFHALSDGTRRAILDRLARGPRSVSALAHPFDATLSAIHQHIQVLEASGLVETEKVGRVRQCRISRKAVAQVEGWLRARRMLWEERFDALGAMLEEDGDG